MKKFEYKILDVKATGFWGGKVDVNALIIKLNELGREGWEVANSVDTNLHHGASRALLVILKREIN